MTEKNDIYYFHQTPQKLCEELIKHVDLKEGDKVFEPFRGEGAFYNSYPDFVEKDWTEITEGRDYKNYEGSIDWVITNPPFKLDDKNKRENSFYTLLKYYSDKVNKGIAFLGNDWCFASLTPKRLEELKNNGLYIHNIIVCNVKKWRGRYFFIILKKEPSDFYKHIIGNF
jgi:type I restriction-modification system DNA methylase subunit